MTTARRSPGLPDGRKARVLIADDSALMRQTLKRIIAGAPDLELAGTARDGADVVAKARELRPDVISMDINMPAQDGITAMQIVLQERICPVVMVSSLTQAGAAVTLECLELGAFDIVGKPNGTVSSNMEAVASELVTKLRTAAACGLGRRREPSPPRVRAAGPKPPIRPASESAVAIGISTGGPSTLQDVLPVLPPDLPAAVFLVQHMPPGFMTAFTKRLDERCAIRVVEARAGLHVEPGVCYVATGGRHLCVHRTVRGEVVIRTPETPVTLFIPAVGVMMSSVLKVYGAGTIGVLMTGIGDDGADAMVEIRAAGGYTIAESAETAVVYGMPREAFERGGACVMVPSHGVAGEIVRNLCRTTS